MLPSNRSPYLDWISIDPDDRDLLAAFHHLLRTVVVVGAKALQVQWVMEEFKVAFVRPSMVDHLGSRDILGDQAKLAERLYRKLVLA